MTTTISPLEPFAIEEVSDTRKGSVVQRVLKMVFEGEVVEGDRLTEASLAQDLGVSRTPVREALIELEGLGVLVLKRNRGAVVTHFGEAKLREIYEVRRVLEVESARRASGRIPNEVIQELMNANREILDASLSEDDWELDLRLHGTIAAWCGNRHLAHEIARYFNLVREVMRAVHQTIEIRERTAEEHLTLLTAIRDGDAESAARCMDEHLHQAEESGVQVIGRGR